MNILKPSVVEPRQQVLIDQFPGNLRQDHLDAYLFMIWHSLLAHLADPIQTVETEAKRHITVLGCVRFSIVKATGDIDVFTLQRDSQGARFVRLGNVVIDLPLKLTGFWLEAYLTTWQDNLDEPIFLC